MIEPQAVQAGESAVSNTTGAWPAASRSARSFASTPCATIFSPSSSPLATVSSFAETVSPPTGMLAAELVASSEPVASVCAAPEVAEAESLPSADRVEVESVVDGPAEADEAERSEASVDSVASPLTTFASDKVICRLMMPT